MESRVIVKNSRFQWMCTGILVIVVIWGWWRCIFRDVPVTTVYIVRHAEKADSGVDPPLSSAGVARANELARVLKDEGIDAVFVTNFTRTQQTGAPVVQAAGISVQQYQATDIQDVVNTILAEHAGDRVLVVGHSNTVDDIAAGLGATGLSDLGEDQFDWLFVVHRFGNSAHLDRLHYGGAAP